MFKTAVSLEETGKTQIVALDKTGTITSEHELGIAVDINADTSKCSSDAVYTWLANNAYKYGFIKRYPDNKIEITGVNNEPWHYRYVGVDAALEMQKKGLCLEEYIETLK